jgi:hypothetical protein
MPDGTPNLTAPAPRAPDGKPDLSGLWQTQGSTGLARNVAENLKAEDIQPWAQSVYQERLLNLGKDVPSARCLPASLLSLNSFPPWFTRIVQTPGLIVLLYQGEGDLYRTFSQTAANSRKIRIRSGWDTRLADGRETRWW